MLLVLLLLALLVLISLISIGIGILHSRTLCFWIAASVPSPESPVLAPHAPHEAGNQSRPESLRQTAGASPGRLRPVPPYHHYLRQFASTSTASSLSLLQHWQHLTQIPKPRQPHANKCQQAQSQLASLFMPTSPSCAPQPSFTLILPTSKLAVCSRQNERMQFQPDLRYCIHNSTVLHAIWQHSTSSSALHRL